MRGLIFCLLAMLVAGCVVTTPERDELPTGVTLLGSDDVYCPGAMAIEGDPDVVVDEGESSVFAVNGDDDVDWHCLSEVKPDSGDMDCPDGTDYVRVSRDGDEPEFTLECYGS